METCSFPAVLDSLEAIGSFVLAAAGDAGLDRKATYRLRLAVDEVATNIITHGYEEAAGGQIVVSAVLAGGTLSLTLEDTAVPFDPRDLAVPEQIHEAAADRPVGGLGVFLALRNVDQF